MFFFTHSDLIIAYPKHQKRQSYHSDIEKALNRATPESYENKTNFKSCCQENTYILENDTACLVIDPGSDTSSILS